jgi:hypothetical protein
MTPTDPTNSVLEAVRDGCRFVAERAARVRIDRDRVAAYAATLEAGSPVAAADPWQVTFGDDIERSVALVLTLDALAFGSGFHPDMHKPPGRSGSVTIATALRQWEATAPITAAGLCAFSIDHAHRIFAQPVDHGAMSELMGLFTTALNDFGALVAGEFGGSFVALVEAAGGSAARLVELLARLPFFDDVCTFDGRRIPFFKRAQLAAADLDRCSRASPAANIGRFVDRDRLTAFADNLVPHVLRVDGVLRYDADLAATIDAGQPLAPGSGAEVEIRACGVYAVELLRRALAERGIDRRSSELDQTLWRRGGAPPYKALPRHRTRSVFY